jgi:hypothetical protein
MGGERKYSRLGILGLAHISGDSSDLPLEAQIVDISYNGMRINVRVPISGRINVTFCCFPDGTNNQSAETVQAEAVWVEKKGLWYSAGLRFVDTLNPQEHSATLTFLDRYLKIMKMK